MFSSSTTRTTQRILEVVKKKGLTGGVDEVVAEARKHTGFRIQERYVDKDAIAKAILELQHGEEKEEKKQPVTKPEKLPVTLRSRRKMQLDRSQEILYAMLETTERGLAPPKEWVQELSDIVKELEGE